MRKLSHSLFLFHVGLVAYVISREEPVYYMMFALHYKCMAFFACGMEFAVVSVKVHCLFVLWIANKR